MYTCTVNRRAVRWKEEGIGTRCNVLRSDRKKEIGRM